MPSALACSSLRVDVGGIPAIDGLSLEATGDHVLIVGVARALFEATAGLRAAARGDILVDGQQPLDALKAGRAAGAPLDPPMPPAWTVRQYVTWSSRLSGQPRETARALTAEAIDRMKLATVADEKLVAIAAATRRGVVVAAALATGASLLILEDPTAALADDVARPFAHVLVKALEDRRTLCFVGRVPLDSPVALAADEAIVVDGSRVAAQGMPAEIAASDTSFVLRLAGDARAFVDAMEARGARLVGPSSDPTRTRVTIEIGALLTLDLLRIAQSSNAVVLELRSLGRSFA